METAGILLEISSPEATLVKMMVGSVTLPGAAGSFEVLKDHAPLISSLDPGIIKYSTGTEERTLSVKSGFVEVRNNKVSVCVEV